MRFPVSLSVSLAVLAALCVCAGAQAPGGSSSSQSPSVQAPAPPPEPTYIAIDPLANVRYDNRFDVSLGMAYAHIKAGPILLQGANLGGVQLNGSYWLTRRWGLEGAGLATVGTSGAAPNPYSINGPFVAQYIFAGGPEWLGPHNKHGALIAHALVGGAYGRFEQDLRGHPPSAVGFYPDQVALAAMFGGHFDLNRSPRWVFRISPDALFTRYNANYSTNLLPAGSRINWNFGISVGVEYKFKRTRF